MFRNEIYNRIHTTRNYLCPAFVSCTIIVDVNVAYSERPLLLEWHRYILGSDGGGRIFLGCQKRPEELVCWGHSPSLLHLFWNSRYWVKPKTGFFFRYVLQKWKTEMVLCNDFFNTITNRFLWFFWDVLLNNTLRITVIFWNNWVTMWIIESVNINCP